MFKSSFECLTWGLDCETWRLLMCYDLDGFLVFSLLMCYAYFRLVFWGFFWGGGIFPCYFAVADWTVHSIEQVKECFSTSCQSPQVPTSSSLKCSAFDESSMRRHLNHPVVVSSQFRDDIKDQDAIFKPWQSLSNSLDNIDEESYCEIMLWLTL